jgi:hypothetical protein
MADTTPKRRIMSISPRMVSMNLDTKASGSRESLHMAPKQIVEITEAQFGSAELQKLLAAKFIVDISATKRR